MSTGVPRTNVLCEPLRTQAARLPADWRPLVDAFLGSEGGIRLQQQLEGRLAAGATVFPAAVFHALELTQLHAVRVVVLGQDPYHGPGQAMGLAFSVPHGVKLPPSLRNIYKEILRDPAASAPGAAAGVPPDGDLTGWARQGVLLLNTTLTVEEGAAASHAALGWEPFSDALIEAVAEEASPKVFMLWGAHAQRKAPLIEAAGGRRGLASRHLVLQANHPSPLSATRGPVPFIGCGHFGAAQRFGAAQGWRIDWAAPAA